MESCNLVLKQADVVILSQIKGFVNCVILVLRMSFISYVFVLFTIILENTCTHHISAIFNEFHKLSDDQKFVFMLEHPICNLVSYLISA